MGQLFVSDEEEVARSWIPSGGSAAFHRKDCVMNAIKRFVTGFPYIANWTLVNFRREPPADRICSLCGVLPGDTLSIPCGHVFCRRCFQGLALPGGELVACPIDGTECSAQHARVDSTAPELFRYYPVGCKNKGCLHVPTLSSYEKHIDLCEHQLVLCELCSRRMQVSQVLPHVRSDCRRTSTRALEDRKEASARAVFNTGASPPVAAARLLQDALSPPEPEKHADRCELVSQELKILRLTIHEELRSFKTALEEAKASITDDRSPWKLSQLVPADPAQQVMGDSVVETLGKELNAATAVEEDTPPSSCFVWKVGDFARLRNEALEGKTPSFSSASFYCGGTGYRMFLQGSLGGGTTGNPCLGLYFVLTAGSFDTSLSWPYAQKTSFVLVSSTPAYNVQGNIKPESEGEEWGHCFRKPKPGEDNEGFGFSQFITLEDLSNPDYGYVKDNSFTINFLTQLKA